MTKIIVAKNKIDCEHLLGQFLDESHFDTVINEDTDCYFFSEDEQNIAFKFRKNFFTKEEQEQECSEENKSVRQLAGNFRFQVRQFQQQKN